MKNILVESMAQLTPLSEEETLAIEQSYPIKTFGKGTCLLKEGQIAKDAFMIVQGCVRKYLMADGEEVTTDFYTEGHTAADFHSLANQQPTRYNFICTEETTVAIVNEEKEEALYKRFPRFETICRVEFQKMSGTNEHKLATFNARNPEEKYLILLEERPDLFQRVPQYQIASYLGIKPETLSRIRKRISGKEVPCLQKNDQKLMPK